MAHSVIRSYFPSQVVSDVEKLSYEYDLLLTAYERLKSRHEVLIISLSG